MVARKTTKRRTKRKPAKKQGMLPNLWRIAVFFLLFFLLVFSLCSAGYVIFFRTVFAQEIMPTLKSSIVFEEPDPPVPLEIPTLNVEVVEETVAEETPEVIEELPKVALIIDDIGYQYTVGKQLLDIPLELTFSFLPFATYTKQLEAAAHELGKTVFLHLPLQPQSEEFDPGPGALLVSDSPEVQLEKLKRCLQEVPHAVGVNNHMGSLFTEDRESMGRVMSELSSQSLHFIDSYTTSNSVALESARSYGIKSARRNVFLDNEADENYICGQLAKLVALAKEQGEGIGIAHPHEETLGALQSCAPQFASEVEYVSILELL